VTKDKRRRGREGGRVVGKEHARTYGGVGSPKMSTRRVSKRKEKCDD